MLICSISFIIKKNFLFKKSLLGGLLVVFSIIGIFYACSKKDVLVLEDKKESSIAKNGDNSQDSDRLPKKLFLQDFNFIGEKHNEGLDFVLKKIVEARKTGKSLEEVKSVEFVLNCTIDFIAQDAKLKSQVKYLQDDKQNIVNQISAITKNGSREYLKSNKDLSDIQKKYSLELLSLPNLNWASSVHNLVKNIQNSDLSVQEQYPLFAMASVALKSAEYWIAKEELWKKALSIQDNKPILEEYTIVPTGINMAVVEADCSAAGGAAVGSLPLVAIPGGGWLAFCSRVIASAVVGSAISNMFH